MKASEALKFSKKIKRAGKEFAEMDGLYLRWHEGPIVGFDAQVADDWEPVYSGIKPKAGEIWKYGPHEFTSFVHYKKGVLQEILVRTYINGENFPIADDMIHGQNNWERVLPPVEKKKDFITDIFGSVIEDIVKDVARDSIEVVEIENVDCKSSSSDDRIFRLVCEKPEFGPILPLKRYDKVIFMRTKK